MDVGNEYTPSISWMHPPPFSPTSSTHVEAVSELASVRSIVDAYQQIDIDADTRIFQQCQETKEDLDLKKSRLKAPQLEHLYSVQLDDHSFDMADHSSDNRLQIVIHKSLSNVLVQFNHLAMIDIRVLRNGIIMVQSEILPSASSLYSNLYDTCIVHLYNGSTLRLEKCTPNIFRYALLELERYLPSVTPILQVHAKKSFRFFKRAPKKTKNEPIPPKRARIWNTKRSSTTV